eukprot:scaffold3947_cov179-Amphora_coffeaeformis.AAC.8
MARRLDEEENPCGETAISPANLLLQNTHLRRGFLDIACQCPRRQTRQTIDTLLSQYGKALGGGQIDKDNTLTSNAIKDGGGQRHTQFDIKARPRLCRGIKIGKALA